MPTVLPPEPMADVVCLGVGYMSGAIAAELSIPALNNNINYKVVGITKGPYWDYVNDFSTTKYDEWGVGLGRKYDSPLPLQSVTIRNNSQQFALPVRRYTMPIQYHALGHGVGGAAQHYGGTMGRQGPWGYQQRSLTDSKYPGMLTTITPHTDLEDWPRQYSEYEPYYVEWEKAHGLCGNYNGSPTNSSSDTNFPWMSQNYPLPPHPLTPVAQSFQTATQALGYHPFPHVSALASQPYTNQYGVPVNPCVYDGYCGGPCDYACETGAKANAAYRTIPAAQKSGNFTLVTNSFIFRLNLDSSNLISSVMYYDPQGNIHTQPGRVFFNGLWGYNMIRTMWLSGVGVPYRWNSDPTMVSGSLGRGLTNGYLPYKGTSVSATLPSIGGNSYPAGNGSGGSVDIYDLMDDNFDHTGISPFFIGGSQIGAGGYPGGGPGNITFAGGSSSTNMGGTFKATQKDKYLPTKTSLGATPFAHDLPTTDNYVDIDPHYTDAYGDPVARLTYDWTPNTFNGATYLANKCAAIFTKMGATNVTVGSAVAAGSAHNDWWGHHLRGGCRIGINASSSVWNKWNQCWAPYYNIFGAGEITNTSGDNVPSGTHVAGAQSYVAADGIRKYLALSVPGQLT
jgi:gluconate 2-dehydrogenase alpha chain